MTMTPIENRIAWNAYGTAKDEAIAAGACSECSQRLALAAVTVPGERPSQAPVLHPRCARKLPTNPERTTHP